MSNLLTDLRYGLRVLARNRGATAAAVSILALGIGANNVMVSVTKGVLLTPLLYPRPEQLVMVWEIYPPENIDYIPASAPGYMDWRAQSRVFDDLAAMVETHFNLTEGGNPERCRGGRVTSSLFSLLGVEPALGRALLPEEEKPGNNRVVVLSHVLWQRRYGSDPGLVGKLITLDGESHTVVGIMPRGFEFPPPFSRDGEVYATHHELWAPLVLTPEQLNQRLVHYLKVIGRLKRDVGVTQAQAEMDAIVRQVSRDYPDEHADIEAHVVTLHDQVLGFVRPAILLLLAAVGLVLLIACANVANLLLAWGAVRRREMAVRSALGACRWRMYRQLLTESLLLAVLGGGLGLLLAYWGTGLLIAYVPGSVPHLDKINLDLGVVGLTFMVSLLTGIVFGLAPAWWTPRIDLQESLKEGDRMKSAGSAHRRLTSSLVVLEVALSLTLLIGASVLIRSFVRLRDIHPGFEPRNLLVLDLTLPESKYGEEHERAAFYHQVVERLARLPGIQSVGASSHLPLSGVGYGSIVFIEGRAASSLKDIPTTVCGAITPDYLRTMGIPLTQGRPFTGRDTGDSNPVAIINQTMARRYFPNTDPLGKRIKVGQPGDDVPWRTIVGVAGDVRQWGLTAEIRPETYLPRLQDPFRSNRAADPGGMSLAIRSEADLSRLVPMIRDTLKETDSETPLSNIRTMEEIVSGLTASHRFSTLLLGLFAGIALTLAGVGIFSVIASSVTQRTHEMGIRMALGAEKREVVRLMVGKAMTLILTGVILGWVGGFHLIGLMSGLLYGVSRTDPLSLVGAPILLTAVALLASYIPARRAASADPIATLRYE